MPPNTSQSSGKTLPILIGGVVILVGIIAFLGLRGSEFSNLESLPAEQYLEKPADFLGNIYSLRAQIDSQISWEKHVGRILAVSPEGSGTRLPVFVPASVEDNINIGQRFEMRTRIEEGGLIYVEALRKY